MDQNDSLKLRIVRTDLTANLAKSHVFRVLLRKPSSLDVLLKALFSVFFVLLAVGVRAESSADSTKPQPKKQLDPAKFAAPDQEYRPIDCWWWDGAPLDRERLRWQLEDMHAKGVGGTWL